jgi:L-alanine-DL-glutamate epimerase-like enolase superfamily enzyme
MNEEVDGRLQFRLDPNQGYTVEDAVRVCAKLSDAGVYLQYLEQPIRIDAHGSLAQLRSRTRQPIAANEDTYRDRNLRQVIAADAIDVAVLDFTPAGGISGLRQLAGIAEDAGLSTVHHCAFDLGVRTAAVLHAVSGIPGFNLPSDTVYYGWERDIITDPFEISEGQVDVPSDPGLGISVDTEAVDRYRLD